MEDTKIASPVGGVGNTHNDALAGRINGLLKAAAIHRRGSWRSFKAVEFATLEWVDWFKKRRLLEPITNFPPADLQARFLAQSKVGTMVEWVKQPGLR